MHGPDNKLALRSPRTTHLRMLTHPSSYVMHLPIHELQTAHIMLHQAARIQAPKLELVVSPTETQFKWPVFLELEGQDPELPNVSAGSRYTQLLKHCCWHIMTLNEKVNLLCCTVPGIPPILPGLH